MTSPTLPAGTARFPDLYHDALRKVVMALAYVACAALMVMVIVTSIEVVLRIFRTTATGA